jgi:hypothetical protein
MSLWKTDPHPFGLPVAMLHTPWRLKRGARQDFGLAVAGRVRVRS